MNYSVDTFGTCDRFAMRMTTEFNFLLLVMFITGLSCHGITSDPCFSPGECVDSILVDVLLTNDEYECLETCAKEETCGWFTYFPNTQACQLYQNCPSIDIQLCQGCLTGKGDCIPEEPKCWILGECKGHVLFSQEVSSEVECLRLCKAQRGCRWFTFVLPDSPCILFSDCNEFDESSEDCVSGESRCTEDVVTTTITSPTTTSSDVEPFWHMLIGGDGLSYKLKSIELFNWETGEQCYYGEIPDDISAHSGEIFGGVPTYCGGNPSEGGSVTNCYKFDKESNIWKHIGSLLGGVFWAGSVVVPTRGWFIYGGYGNPTSTSQKLKSIDSQWEAGPPLYENRINKVQCIVQLNDATTVFLGGQFNPKNIVSFNWDTMSYTKHSAVLTYDRKFSACALLKSDGGHLVVVASGTSKGLEAWNPVTDQVTVLNSNFPSATRENRTPKLISIKGGFELIFYEADKPYHGIWRYVHSTYTWTQIGQTLEFRDDFVALPVEGISCP